MMSCDLERSGSRPETFEA